MATKKKTYCVLETDGGSDPRTSTIWGPYPNRKKALSARDAISDSKGYERRSAPPSGLAYLDQRLFVLPVLPFRLPRR